MPTPRNENLKDAVALLELMGERVRFAILNASLDGDLITLSGMEEASRLPYTVRCHRRTNVARTGLGDTEGVG